MREISSSPIVLFDLDGTLIATKSLYLECYRRAIAEATGDSPLSDEKLFALEPRAELRFLPEQSGEGEACLESFYRHYENLHEKLFEGIYAGVPEMLESLRTRGARLGIVTGKSRRGWGITGAQVELGRFEVFICDDDVVEPKPDPEGLRLALERLGAPPAGALYVGDTLGDVRAARAAGMIAGAALWPKRKTERGDFAARATNAGAVLLDTPEDVALLAMEQGA